MVNNEREPLLWHRLKREVRRLLAGNLEIFNKLRGLLVRNLSLRGLYLRFLAGRITFVDAPGTRSVATIVQIPGQTDPCYSPFNKGIARSLCAAGYHVIRSDFKGQAINQAKHKLTDPQVNSFCDQLVRHCQRLCRTSDSPLILVGKSLGGAIATKALDRTVAAGCVVLGYPFQKEGSHWDRLSHLENIKGPVVIIQGEDDRYGGKNLVARLTLSESINLVWIAQAGHGFKHHTPALKDALAGACQAILKASDCSRSEAECQSRSAPHLALPDSSAQPRGVEGSRRSGEC